MNKAKRAQVIRQCFKAKFAGFSYTPGKRQSREPVRRWANERFNRTGFALVNRGPSQCTQAKKWMLRPDANAGPAVRVKRARGESALNAIARKLDGKPKRWA